ncbi:MAG: hypothetical protein JWQ57_4478, partial [Mucilaginibacter sp.]|nr:hypothetical protein [Mucilaginibacter sp.]
MEKEQTESSNEEAVVQSPPETEEKKTGQAEISAITDVTTHERFEKLNIKTIIHHESNQYVNQNNNQDNQHIDFVLFTKKNNQDTIPEFSDESVKEFQASRIMVINYASKFDEIALQAAEKIAFEHDIKHNFKPICCSIHDHHSIKLDKLIRYAADDKTFNANQEQILIVFEQRPEETSADFIAHLMKKGGPADIVSAGLRNKKLYLIYVCQNDKLFETRPFGQTHFGLYLIDPYVLAFYAAKSDAKFAMDDYLTAMNAIRMTGWLNDYPEEQKISVLTGLSCLGQLKTEADQQLKSIDKIQESKVVTGLMGEPVKNMILFIVAFFDGINLSEFDDLATTLLLTIPALQNDHLQTNASPSPLKDWHLRSDELLSDCGIYLDNTADKKVASYKFRMEIRREIVVELFRNKYRMALTRRQELIANQAVSQPLAYSRAYIDSWLKLFFETAALDPYRYLLGFALKLANLIIDEDETALNQDEKIRLQMMLIDCIG